MMRATLTGAVATARVAFATDCTTTAWAPKDFAAAASAKISIAAAGANWAMKYGDKLFQSGVEAPLTITDDATKEMKVFMAGQTAVCAKEMKFALASKANEAAKPAEIKIKDVVAAGTVAEKIVIVGDADTPVVGKKAILYTAATLAKDADIASATDATATKLVSATTIGASLYAISEDKKMEKVETVGSADANKGKFVNVAYTLKKGEADVKESVKSLDIIEANGQALVLAYTDNADKSHIAVAADASVAAPAFVVKADLEGKPSAVMPKGESTYVVIGEKLYVVKGSTVTELLDKVKAAALAGETLRLGRATGTPEKTNLFEAPIATCPKPPTPAVTTTTTAKVTTAKVTTATGTTKSGSTLATVSSAALVAAAAVLII